MSIFLNRVRHEIKKRELVVRENQTLTPNMRRVVFTGDDLSDFVSMSPDDHVKLFFKTENGFEMRDYTPRAFDNVAHELVIDFALHENGIATDWVRGAKTGDIIEIGGPRGSLVVEGAEWWVLIGDETAIPAIARRLEELTNGTNVTAIIAITDPKERQDFNTEANLNLKWIIRPEGDKTNPQELLFALESTNFPDGEGYVWVACEAHVTRKIREYLLTTRKHPPKNLKASGYWVKGQMGAHEKFE
jgi:NADPH-dependent ferric siderophore reductase